MLSNELYNFFVNNDLTDWWLSIYVPLIIYCAITAISFWRWYYVLHELRSKYIMKDLIFGIALGFTILTYESLINWYFLLLNSPPHYLLTIIAKIGYLFAAYIHSKAVFKLLDTTGRVNRRIIAIGMISWFMALAYFILN